MFVFTREVWAYVNTLRPKVELCCNHAESPIHEDFEAKRRLKDYVAQYDKLQEQLDRSFWSLFHLLETTGYFVAQLSAEKEKELEWHWYYNLVHTHQKEKEHHSSP